jgi:hypothetical protein
MSQQLAVKTRTIRLAATLLGVILCGSTWTHATFAHPLPENQSSTDAIIDELVSTPNFGVVYIADGAGETARC